MQEPPNQPSQPWYPSQPLPPPPGGYYAPPSAPMYGMPPYGAIPPMMGPRKPEPTAVALEAICALFGIYGVGWLMSGKTQIGVPLLIGGLIWMAIVFVGTFLTAFLGLCCFVPLHLIFIATSTLLLANQQL